MHINLDTTAHTLARRSRWYPERNASNVEVSSIHFYLDVCALTDADSLDARVLYVRVYAHLRCAADPSQRTYLAGLIPIAGATLQDAF